MIDYGNHLTISEAEQSSNLIHNTFADFNVSKSEPYRIIHKQPKMNFKNTFAFLIFCFSITVVQAQHFTETEIQVQSIFLKGEQQRILGNHEKAEELYKEVLSKDPTNDVAAYALSRSLQAQNKDDEAIKFGKKATEIDGSNIWYKKFLGDLYQKTNRNAEGAAIYQQLAAANPFFEEYYLKQAFFLVRAGEPTAAITVYEQLQTRIGINEELTRRKHTLYLGQGDNAKAALELEKLADAFPENKTYRHLLADFYNQIGDKAGAKKVYKKILDIDPEDAAAKLAIAGEMKKSGNDSQYLQSLKPLFENDKIALDIKVKELIPMIQKVADTGDATLADEALQLCDVLDKAHPEEAKIHSIAGDLYFYSGRKSEAKEKYEKTIKLNDGVYLVWEQLLTAQKDLGEFKAMVETSENAMDVFPNQGRIYYLNGFALGATGDYSGALASLQQAQMMSSRNLPLNLDVAARQGWTYFKLKKYDKAANILAKANGKSNGKHPEVLEVLGDVNFQQGDVKAAVENWESALKIYGDARPELQKKIAEKKLN